MSVSPGEQWMKEQRGGSRLGRLLLAVPLAVVVVAPAAASWMGLVAAAHDWFGLTGWTAVLVPLVLDAAALYCAALSLRSVLAGDSATVDRLLVWLYALGSAGLNVWHAANVAAALFFGAASVSAVVLWDRTLRSHRRDALRALGVIEAPLPRFRALRWLVAPGETGRAWREAIVSGVSSPAEALELARRDHGAPISFPRVTVAAEQLPCSGLAGGAASPGFDFEPSEHELVSSAGAFGKRVVKDQAVDHQAVDDQAVGGEEAAELAAVVEADRVEVAACETKREALLLAWRRLGIEGVPATTDVMPAVDWLALRGLRVDKSGAYDLRRRLARKAAQATIARPRPVALAAVGGNR